MRGQLIGRFQDLLNVCDKYSIKRPSILITQWGWLHDRTPRTKQALLDIEKASEMYAQYPELLGAAIACENENGISSQVRSLIKPITKFYAFSNL